MTTRPRRTAGLIALAGMALLVLTACINVSYTLTVNADATLSGTLKAEISKEVLAPLGVTSKDQLNQSITSGDMELGVNQDVAESCKVGEDDTNYTITCTILNAQAADINEAWSLTKTGNELTLHVVTEGQAATGDEAAMPEMNLGNFSFTAAFPGEISSITGTGATKTAANTVQANGTLSDSIDFTVVGSSEATGPALKIVFFVLIGVVVIVVLAIIFAGLRQGKKSDAPTETATDETATDVPPTADSSDPSI